MSVAPLVSEFRSREPKVYLWTDSQLHPLSTNVSLFILDWYEEFLEDQVPFLFLLSLRKSCPRHRRFLRTLHHPYRMTFTIELILELFPFTLSPRVCHCSRTRFHDSLHGCPLQTSLTVLHISSHSTHIQPSNTSRNYSIPSRT